MPIKKILSITGFVVLTACCSFIINSLLFGENSGEANNVGSTQALFAATFPDENGKAQALKQWQGKTVVLNFWATWCPPCREEMPELSALNTEYQSKNVVVVGIAIDEVGLIKEFTNETKISYPLLSAENEGMDLAASLGNNMGVLPYTVIIKADGTVEKTYFGKISKPLLEEALAKLL